MRKSKIPGLSIPISPIASFEIRGLHGEKNVILKFQKGVKIIVADNGSGKTTILNTLYSILEGNFSKLGWLEFKEIRIKFTSGSEVVILRNEIPDPLIWTKTSSPIIEVIKRYLSSIQEKELYLIVEKSNDEDEFRENLSQSLRRAIASLPYAPLQLFRLLRELRTSSELNGKKLQVALQSKWKTIQREFDFSVIYMPTYRRVEEDIRTLGLSSRIPSHRQVEGRHIFFGMSDVRDTFERVTSEIRNSTSETFRKVSSRVIDQLLDGGISRLKEIDISRLKDQDAINLVLKRLGKELPEDRLSQLNAFIKTPSQADSDGRMLLYLLNNFFGIYESQIENDRKIKFFIAVANNYLVNKELRYDEVSIKIGVFSKISNDEIELDRLSSGEKQLVSILARLYLSNHEEFAIIIDEPELSLSIDWQRTLLPDLMRSGKCKFLLAATHSPFIFENELEKFTSAIFMETAK